MNEQQQETAVASEPMRGHPVDVREEEFVQFSLTVAKTFGALKMRVPTAIGFALYLLMSVVFIALDYRESGEVSWILLGIAAIACVCALPGLWWIPRQTAKKARDTYRANNDREYYGEWSIRDGVLVKSGGYKQWTIPLNQTAAYLEDTDFMAFSAAADRQHVILLPARCMTEEMAAQVRQAVFDPSCRIHRQVLHRMQARATQPIPYRDAQSLPRTLFDLRFAYTPEELRDYLTDVGRDRMIARLPATLIGAISLGAVLGLWIESLWALIFAVPSAMLLTVLISSLTAAANAKRISEANTVSVSVMLTERGVDYEQKPLGIKMHMRWQAVRRASESDKAVELRFTDGQMLRIPKRCIDDMDQLRSVIDTHRET